LQRTEEKAKTYSTCVVGDRKGKLYRTLHQRNDSFPTEIATATEACLRRSQAAGKFLARWAKSRPQILVIYSARREGYAITALWKSNYQA
jgi:hypothetical protein